MLRSRFLLSVSGPAALLALLAIPMIRSAADAASAPAAPASGQVAYSGVIPVPLPGMRPVTTAISPVRVATAPQVGKRDLPGLSPQAAESDKAQLGLKPRRSVREGCETAVSSLVGPEARRMVPGRCIA